MLWKTEIQLPFQGGKTALFQPGEVGKSDDCCCSLLPQGLQSEETLVKGAEHSKGTELHVQQARGVAKVSLH